MSNWYIQILGTEVGPLSSAQLKQKATEGKIERDTLVRRDGLDTWNTADKVKGLFPELPPPPPAKEVDPVVNDAAQPVKEEWFEKTATASLSNPYSVPLRESRGGAVRTPRPYVFLEILAMVFRVLGMLGFITGFCLLLFVSLQMNGPSAQKIVWIGGVFFAMCVWTFLPLLVAQIIKLLINVADDIKHIADQQ